MAGSLFLYVTMRQPMEFVVDKRHELIECRLVAIAPGDEQLSNFIGRLCHSGCETSRTYTQTGSDFVPHSTPLKKKR